MSARHSFRTRLAVQTMLVAGVVLAAFGTASWWYARQQLARDLDLRITESARRIWARLTPRTTAAEFTEAMQGIPVAMVVIANEESGRVIFTSHPALSKTPQPFLENLPGPALIEAAVVELERRGVRPPGRDGPPDREGPPDRNGPPGREPPPRRVGDGVLRRQVMPEIRDPVFFTVAALDGGWRFGALSNPRFTVFAGRSLHDFHSDVRRAAWWYAAAGAIGLMIAGLGAWWSSARAMRPLDRIVATARHLTASDLDLRIPSGPRDDREFSQLITVLNGMMDRLQTSFQQAARFTADASHELKTPLSVMQVTLHDSLRRGTLGHDELESLARECSRLKSITHSLLLLSQADAGKLPLARERYDFSHDIARLVEDAEAICENAGLRCEHEIEPGLHIDADRALMRHVFQNLLSNAVKYNCPNGLLKITLSSCDDHAVFTIANTGPGIPAAAQPRLFERFFRADAARTSEGAGLGLNIAYELARANGAELRLLESDGEHTRFQVRVPLGAEVRV